VPDAKAVGALERWSLAAIRDAPLAPAMGPTQPVRDGDLGARVHCPTLGATSMAPAEPLGFGFLRAPVDFARGGST
jgi:hypothetical protein